MIKIQGQWLVLAAAVLWGTTGTSQAFAPDGTQPVIVGTVRLTIGGITLLALAAARGALRPVRSWPLLTTLAAAVSIAAYQLCFFAAVARTGVAVGTIVGIGSAPVMAGVLAFIIRKERPGSRWPWATLLAVIGCSLLAASSDRISVDAFGLLLALGAGAAYAAYTVASKSLLEQHPPDVVLALVFCLGALLLSPLWLTGDLTWLAQPRGLAVALHLGVVTTAVAYTLFSQGLMVIPSATAVTLTLAEPLTAGLLGVAVLGEQLAPLALLGIGLLFSGLALLAVNPRRTGARSTATSKHAA